MIPVECGRSLRFSTSDDDWAALAGVLERQHGVIGRGQLDEGGVTKMQLQGWVADRRLERVAPRAWRLVGAPNTWEQRLHVGLLTLGSMSWVSHDAAAQIHGFDRTPQDRVEFLVIRRKRTIALGERVHSTRRWGPTDAFVVDGVGFWSGCGMYDIPKPDQNRMAKSEDRRRSTGDQRRKRVILSSPMRARFSGSSMPRPSSGARHSTPILPSCSLRCTAQRGARRPRSSG